jgi:hypothetical protein
VSAALVGTLLRSPGEVARACREDGDLRAIALVSLASIVSGAAAFGGVVGSFRGGAQIAYAALKLPLAVVVTLAIAAPAFHAIAASFGRAWPMRSVVALALAAAARSSLVLLALSPALWLLLDWGGDYHLAAVAASLAYGVAGLSALGVLVRGLGEGPNRAVTALAFVGIFFAVGGQASWILRPYLVRPRTEGVPFLRGREGSFADAIVTSARSAAGIYDHDELEWEIAPSPIDRGQEIPMGDPAVPEDVDGRSP